MFILFFFQAEDGIRVPLVTGVQTCALPIYRCCNPSDLPAAPPRVEIAAMASHDLCGLDRIRPSQDRAVGICTMVSCARGVRDSTHWPRIRNRHLKSNRGARDIRPQKWIPPSRYPPRTRVAQLSNSDHGGDKFPTEHLT